MLSRLAPQVAMMCERIGTGEDVEQWAWIERRLTRPARPSSTAPPPLTPLRGSGNARGPQSTLFVSVRNERSKE